MSGLACPTTLPYAVVELEMCGVVRVMGAPNTVTKSPTSLLALPPPLL